MADQPTRPTILPAEAVYVATAKNGVELWKRSQQSSHIFGIVRDGQSQAQPAPIQAMDEALVQFGLKQPK